MEAQRVAKVLGQWRTAVGGNKLLLSVYDYDLATLEGLHTLWHVISIINVGYDDDDVKSYSVEVGLIPQPGGGTEFYFNLIEVDDDAGTYHRYWCGKDVARFMTPPAETIKAIPAEQADYMREVRSRNLAGLMAESGGRGYRYRTSGAQR